MSISTLILIALASAVLPIAVQDAWESYARNRANRAWRKR